jgi:hypothetical protein
MKDGALQSLVKRFRAVQTLTLQAWWRCVCQRKIFKIIIRRIKKLQRGVQNFLKMKRYAKAEKYVTKVQARVRGRKARAWITKLRRIRANAQLIVAAIFVGRLRRVRYRKIRRAFMSIQLVVKFKRRMRRRALRKASVIKMQSFYRMFTTMKKFMRIRYVRLNGASVIQSKWKSYKARINYCLLRRSVIAIQCRHRFKMRHRLRKKRARYAMRIAIAVKHWYRRLIRSFRFKSVTKISAWFRGISTRVKYTKSLKAARKVCKQLRQKVERRALDKWTLDLHGAAAWGKVDEVVALLRCDNPIYARVKNNVPLSERALVRNRFDGLKSVLHTASQSGETACFKLLLQFTPIDTSSAPLRDLLGQTPLHKAVAFGDSSHAEIVQMLLEHKVDVNAVNHNGETPLDTAIAAAMKTSSVMARAGGHFSTAAVAVASSKSVASHAKLISMLLSAGAVPSPSSLLTMNQIHTLLSTPTNDGTRGFLSSSSLNTSTHVSNSDINTDPASKWHVSASDDPHYKLLCLAETERLKRKAASAARALLTTSTTETLTISSGEREEEGRGEGGGEQIQSVVQPVDEQKTETIFSLSEINSKSGIPHTPVSSGLSSSAAKMKRVVNLMICRHLHLLFMI